MMKQNRSILRGECYIELNVQEDIEMAELMPSAEAPFGKIKLTLTNEQYDKLAEQFVKEAKVDETINKR